MGDSNAAKENILSILSKRPIVGDGSYVFTLEKRGYVKAGEWTPQAVVEYPDGVRQLHREYLRAGADVLQAFTFYAASGKLKTVDSTKEYTSDDLNDAACHIVKEVAATKPGTLICGGLSPTPTYLTGAGEAAVKKEFRAQIDIFSNHKVDFLLAEFLAHVEEAEWAIQAMKETKLPVACTLRMGPTGDLNNISPGECAVRMAKAGADILGLNCQYDYRTCIEVIKVMKAALDAEGLKPFLMIQPVGFHVPEVREVKFGYHDLPEFPFALESRLLTRWDCREFAREAYKAGVRYFGGCCGFEPYHMREIAAELAKERGFLMPGADKFSDWAASLATGFRQTIANRNTREHWENIKPASGRPDCASISKPDTIPGEK